MASFLVPHCRRRSSPPLIQRLLPCRDPPGICDPDIPSDGTTSCAGPPTPIKPHVIVPRGTVGARSAPISPDLMHVRFPGSRGPTDPRPNPDTASGSALSQKLIPKRGMPPLPPASLGASQRPRRRDTLHTWRNKGDTTGAQAAPRPQTSRRRPTAPPHAQRHTECSIRQRRVLILWRLVQPEAALGPGSRQNCKPSFRRGCVGRIPHLWSKQRVDRRAELHRPREAVLQKCSAAFEKQLESECRPMSQLLLATFDN